ncbi:hypothetical protein CN333_00015 [Bacillus thuringiensis]|uniref:HNH endonuclease n=1 Tax=Bacillus cereus group TaxID=86661 RepID=UPI000BFA9C43|nr:MULTISPECIES: HNH endonuclease [Bacillus cereus group]MCC2383483.1 HNH endonuclease [Bacillus cereus]PFE80017.1 hypothetical protein CN333_00015 [Bacillus thuringiensis]
MSLGKRTRFEVFKRDSFKCQYCGRSAPDVVLEVDHIKPKSKGGTNDLINLITSCFDCNRGKGPIEITDSSVIEKQKEQLDALNEKRLQLEMLLEWRDELDRLDDDKVNALNSRWKKFIGRDFTTEEEIGIRKLLNTHDLIRVTEALDFSIKNNLKYDQKGSPLEYSIGVTFERIKRLCNWLKRKENNPQIEGLAYARGIIRNRFPSVSDRKAWATLNGAYSNGKSVEEIQDIAKEAGTWSDFSFRLTLGFEEGVNE